MLPARTTQRGADKIGRVTPLACSFSRRRTAAGGVRNRCSRRRRRFLSPRVFASDGVPIGELFAHMSGLYFRGKITYARKFGRAFVITPDQGLMPAETTITSQVLIRFADAEIDLGNPGYRTPLEQTARALDEAAGADAQFVLLGSIASDKYVQVLSAIFGQRLVFPADVRRAGRHEPRRGAAARRRRVAGARVHPGHRRRPPRQPGRPKLAAREPFFPHNSHTLMCGSISGGGVCSTSSVSAALPPRSGTIALLTQGLRLVSVRRDGRGARACGAAEFLRPQPLDVARPAGRRPRASGFAATGAIRLPRPPRSPRISPSRPCSIHAGLPAEIANTAAVLACAIPNYLVSERLVFRHSCSQLLQRRTPRLWTLDSGLWTRLWTFDSSTFDFLYSPHAHTTRRSQRWHGRRCRRPGRSCSTGIRRSAAAADESEFRRPAGRVRLPRARVRRSEEVSVLRGPHLYA